MKPRQTENWFRREGARTIKKINVIGASWYELLYKSFAEMEDSEYFSQWLNCTDLAWLLVQV
jgi:hypothetical protein